MKRFVGKGLEPNSYQNILTQVHNYHVKKDFWNTLLNNREFVQDLLILHTTSRDQQTWNFSKFNAQTCKHLSHQRTKKPSWIASTETSRTWILRDVFYSELRFWIVALKHEHTTWHLKYWAHQMSVTTKTNSTFELRKLNLLHKSKRFPMRRHYSQLLWHK